MEADEVTLQFPDLEQAAVLPVGIGSKFGLRTDYQALSDCEIDGLSPAEIKIFDNGWTKDILPDLPLLYQNAPDLRRELLEIYSDKQEGLPSAQEYVLDEYENFKGELLHDLASTEFNRHITGLPSQEHLDPISKAILDLPAWNNYVEVDKGHIEGGTIVRCCGKEYIQLLLADAQTLHDLSKNSLLSRGGKYLSKSLIQTQTLWYFGFRSFLENINQVLRFPALVTDADLQQIFRCRLQELMPGLNELSNRLGHVAAVENLVQSQIEDVNELGRGVTYADALRSRRYGIETLHTSLCKGPRMRIMQYLPPAATAIRNRYIREQNELADELWTKRGIVPKNRKGVPFDVQNVDSLDCYNRLKVREKRLINKESFVNIVPVEEKFRRQLGLGMRRPIKELEDIDRLAGECEGIEGDVPGRGLTMAMKVSTFRPVRYT